MRKRFFVKNLALFLVPMVVPLLLLGSLSFLAVQRYVNNEVERNNTNLFTQIDQNIQLLFHELDSLYLSFSSPGVIYSLKEVLRTQTLTYEQNQLMNTLKASIDTPANARPYIESVYVYIENDNGFFLTSTTEGLARLGDYPDHSWFDGYRRGQSKQGIFAESRTITRYSFEKPTPITTVYKSLTSTTRSSPDGVIALNLRTRYIESLLQHIETLPNQSLLIADENNRILFQNRDYPYLRELDLERFNDNSGKAVVIKLGGESYSLLQLQSPDNGWKYISVTPRQSLYAIPSQLSLLTLLSIGLAMLLGLALAAFMTWKSVAHIQLIVSTIRSHERGVPRPGPSPSVRADEYGFIVNNILQSFAERNQLKLQLSEEKYLLKSAELLALQNQINPHFLFNTLETIYWKTLSLTGRPNAANAMLENLSNLLRYALDGSGEIVHFETEMKVAKSYIDIQKIRYPHTFDVVWEYDEQEIQSCRIVKMTLQPLIENAIYHGLKEKRGEGRIKVKAQLQSTSCMRITVTDNGVGMSPEWLAAVGEHVRNHTELTGHIGLFNTNKRLRLTYGESYRIHIRSKQGLGTVIDLYLPYVPDASLLEPDLLKWKKDQVRA
ncbi:sensor histidine kinase [Paenibacillus hodogayensis]|uniref:Sensor histidine kinase n=1 Tax=Paenibacillus hodogayensis TaxID=279208 RepID=A0ABV5VWS3_9BACL